MCCVIAFHITDWKVVISEKRCEGPNTQGLRNNAKSGEQAGKEGDKDSCQCATWRLWFPRNTLETMMKNPQRTLCLCPPCALRNSGRRRCRSRSPDALQCACISVLAFLSLSSPPLHFLHIPQSIIRLSFCTPLRSLFHPSLISSKIWAKSCCVFCFVIS